MKELSWNPILSNLVEARGELVHLHWRLHYIAFGRLPDEAEAKRICPLWVDWQNGGKEEFEAHLAREEEKRPFSEMALFNSLEHAYHHINWAWNVRRTPEERGALAAKFADALCAEIWYNTQFYGRVSHWLWL